MVFLDHGCPDCDLGSFRLSREGLYSRVGGQRGARRYPSSRAVGPGTTRRRGCSSRWCVCSHEACCRCASARCRSSRNAAASAAWVRRATARASTRTFSQALRDLSLQDTVEGELPVLSMRLLSEEPELAPWGVLPGDRVQQVAERLGCSNRSSSLGNPSRSVGSTSVASRASELDGLCRASRALANGADRTDPWPLKTSPVLRHRVYLRKNVAINLL